MKTPSYADQIIEAMQAQDRPAWQIVGYFAAVLTRIQRDAEDGTLTPKSLLADLAHSAALEEPSNAPNHIDSE